MASLTIDAPAVFKPLDQPSRYKGLHGGRGSGKSWHSATMLVLRCLKEPGLRGVCAREVQKTLAESAKRLIEDRIISLDVGPHVHRPALQDTHTRKRHERQDEHREVGLGPLHDWSSHAADAFGLMAISYEEPSATRAFNRKLSYGPVGIV